MKKYQNSFLLLAALSFFFETDPAFEVQSEISIGNMRVVEGDKGQRSVEVMVMLSQPSSSPVTVAYSTRNGTALAGSNYIAASGTITFTSNNIMKKITISVNGNVNIEANLTFEVVLSNVVGAIIANSIGTVTIVNDDFRPGGLSAYEVKLTFIGYTTFAGTPANCPIRPSGYVVLTGLLEGLEKVSPDDDISYTGTLQMDMDIDICSAKPEYPNKECGITVVGSGPVYTELTIYFDHRGGYITTKNKTGAFTKSVGGTCDQGQMIEERGMVPNETIASVFNGMELPMLTDRTLRGKPPYDPVQTADGKMMVEVIRVIK